MSDSFVTPQTVAHQTPLSMGFPSQEYWSGLPFLSAGDLSSWPRGWTHISCIGGGFFTTEPSGKPCIYRILCGIYTGWGKSSKQDRNIWAQEKWSAFKILSGIWAEKRLECRQPTPNLCQAQFTQWLLETLFSLSPLISFWIPNWGRRICIRILYIIIIIIYIRILVQYYKFLYIYWGNICVQPN